MCTPGVAVPCLCDAGQGCAMLLHLRTIDSSRARTLVLPCVLTPRLPPCAIAHLTSTHSPSSLYSLLILSPLACHHFPEALSIPLSSPNRPYPILATFLSMTCVLKRFPLTSPRKLALPCAKRGFLRTSEPHRTSQLSPCAPQVSQCHVMRCLAVMCYAPAPPHHRHLPRANSCRALCPNSTSPTLRHRTSDTRPTFHPLPTHIPLLSRRTSHHFVISTPAISNFSHVSFHDVRTKTFFTHVTT